MPLSYVVCTCVGENTWPSMKKEARVAPVHKKNSKSKLVNHRPVSLLSAVGEVSEGVVAEVICRHLNDKSLLSNQQLGFRSTSDLQLLLSRDWQDALNDGLETLVIALDIADASDRVWNAG